MCHEGLGQLIPSTVLDAYSWALPSYIKQRAGGSDPTWVEAEHCAYS